MCGFLPGKPSPASCPSLHHAAVGKTLPAWKPWNWACVLQQNTGFVYPPSAWVLGGPWGQLLPEGCTQGADKPCMEKLRADDPYSQPGKFIPAPAAPTDSSQCPPSPTAGMVSAQAALPALLHLQGAGLLVSHFGS